MSNNISGFRDGFGKSKSSSSSPGSFSSFFNVSSTSPSIPRLPLTDHVGNGKDMKEPFSDKPELLYWLKEFGLDDIDKQTLRTICRGPFKDFLYNFCLPYVRPDTWVTTMRMNLDLVTEKNTTEKKVNAETSALYKVNAEILQCKEELEKLDRTEAELIDKLQNEYVDLDEGTIQSLIQPRQANIKAVEERAYQQSLIESLTETNEFLHQMSTFNENDIEIEMLEAEPEENILQRQTRHSIEEFKKMYPTIPLVKLFHYEDTDPLQEDVDNLQNLGSISDLLAALVKILPKYLAYDDKLALMKLKKLLKKTLRKRRPTDLYLLSEEIKNGEDLKMKISKLPYNLDSAGFLEFSNLIRDKIQALSLLHTELHEATKAKSKENWSKESNVSFVHWQLARGALDCPFFKQNHPDIDKTGFLKLLIEEEKAIVALKYYEELDINKYVDLVAAKMDDGGKMTKLDIVKLSSGSTARFRSPFTSTQAVMVRKLLCMMPLARDKLQKGVKKSEAKLQEDELSEEPTTEECIKLDSVITQLNKLNCFSSEVFINGIYG